LATGQNLLSSWTKDEPPEVQGTSPIAGDVSRDVAEARGFWLHEFWIQYILVLRCERSRPQTTEAEARRAVDYSYKTLVLEDYCAALSEEVDVNALKTTHMNSESLRTATT